MREEATIRQLQDERQEGQNGSVLCLNGHLQHIRCYQGKHYDPDSSGIFAGIAEKGGLQ